MRGSTQLRYYLRLKRNGTPTDAAASMAGIGLTEAYMHDKSLAAGEYDDITEPPQGDEPMTDDGIFAALAANLNADAQVERKKRGRPPKSQSAPAAKTAEEPESYPMTAEEVAQTEILQAEMPRVAEVQSGGPNPDYVGGDDMLTTDTVGAAFHDGHAANLDHLATIADDYIADPSALLGSFRDITLELFKNRRMPWHGMSPIEQRDTVAAIDYAGRKIIAEMVIAVAAKNRPSIPAHFKKLGSDGNKMTLTIEVSTATTTRDDQNALHDSLRQDVIIVPADWSAYDRVKREVVPDDEMELPFDAPRPAEPTRQETHGFDVAPPAHPADDSDLAGDDEIVEDIAPLEEAAPVRDDAATWVVTDLDDGETVYLTAQEDAWTASESGAGRFHEQQARDLAFENDAQAVDTMKRATPSA